MNVFLIAALTADGLIAKKPGHISTAWTSPEDLKWFRSRTKDAGVVVMGSTTFDTVGRPMPNRLNIIYSQHPEKYANLGDQVRVTQQTPIDLLESLEKENYSEVAICGGSSIYSMFAKAGVLTKLYLTIEPVLFGKGVGLFNQEIDLKLALVKVTNLNPNSLLLEYDVVSDL